MKDLAVVKIYYMNRVLSLKLYEDQLEKVKEYFELVENKEEVKGQRVVTVYTAFPRLDKLKEVEKLMQKVIIN